MGALRHAFRFLTAMCGVLALGCGVLVAAPVAEAAVTPVLYPDAYALDQNEHITIPAPGFLANDFGVGAGYRAKLVDTNLWAGADLDVNGDGSFSFDPNQDSAGENDFTYCLRLAGGSDCVTGVATVALYVDEPFVRPQSYAVAQGSTLSVPRPGLLQGSQNPQKNDELYLLSAPLNGILSADPDGSFNYTPNPGFIGTDTFNFCLSNDNNKPLCSGNRTTASISVYPFVQNQTIALLANHSYDGRLYPAPVGNISYAGLIITAPAHGSVDIANDGSFTFTPAAGYIGPDAFSFCLSQNDGSCMSVGTTATVSITVNPEDVDTTTAVAGPASVPYGVGATLVATVTPNPGGGTVRFAEGGTPIAGCGAVAVAANATASCALPTTEPVGPHTVVAQFGGVGVYQPSSGQHTVLITPAPTSVTYTGGATGVIGTGITASATLVNTVTQQPVVGGTITFTLDGAACNGTSNAAGSAECILTPSTAGIRTVAVTFAGSPSFQSSNTAAPIQVAKRPSSTTVSAAPAESLWSDPVVLTAQVTTGATGTVAFSAGIPIAGCAAVPLADGIAICTTTALEVGVNSVTATYSGDATYLGSSGSGDVTVDKRPVTVGYGAAATGTVGQPMTATATVTDTATGGRLIGLLLSFVIPTSSCEAMSDTSGTAACALFPATAGDQPVTVTFAGNDHYLSATGTGTALVAPAPTAVTVVAPDTGVFSVPVMITATVAPTNGQGTVGFALGDRRIAGCEDVALTRIDTTWQASCTTADLPVGSDAVTATYHGTPDYFDSSGTAAITVGPAPTALRYTGETSGTVAGSMSMSAVLSNVAGADPVALPDQQLVFTLADLTCTATTDATGTASCSWTPTGVAQAGTLTVQYAATTDFQSSSDSSEVAIAASPTETTVQAPETALFTEPVTITATVAPSNGAGTVAFSVADDPVEGCTDLRLNRTDAGWQAQCTTTMLKVGDDSVTAVFSGTEDYLGSMGSAPVQVDPAPSSLAYTGPTRSTVGQPVELSAVLRNEVDTSAIAGAAVQIAWGEYGCTATTGDDGAASCTVIPDAVADSGAVSLSFAGTSNFLAASSAADIVVGPAPTVTSVTANPTGPFPTPLTLTALVTPSNGAGTVAFTADGAPVGGCDAVELTQGDAGWQATCDATGLGAGDHQFDAAFSGTADYVASSGTGTAAIAKAPTDLGYFGQTAGTVGIPMNVVARLAVTTPPAGAAADDEAAATFAAFAAPRAAAVTALSVLAAADAVADAAITPAPDLSGLTVTFTLGRELCRAVTDADGVARCRITPSASGAEVPLDMSFDGTADLASARLALTAAVALPPVTTIPSAPPTSMAAGPATSTVQDGSAALPDTGFPTSLVIWLAALLLAGGGLLTLAGRGRRDH